MKTRVHLALFSTALSALIHLYMSFHFYPLKFGAASGQSLCNLNSKFNCDAVAVSAYATLLGIPLSVWGFIANLVLFFLMFVSWLEWTEHPERAKRWSLALTAGVLITSIVMGGISFLLMDNYCPFCMVLYALSLVTFVAYVGVLREPFFLHFPSDLQKIWGESRWLLGTTLALPALAFLTHKMFMSSYSDSRLAQVIQTSVLEWKANPKFEFVAQPSLARGPSREAAILTLSEFADFRCSHCRAAHYSLDAFSESHPDIRFEFYSYPLDGDCNEKIEGRTGISCRLAAAVVCAEKQNKGWALHNLLFDQQDQNNRASSVKELDIFLEKQVSQISLSWTSIESCMAQSEVLDSVKAQAKQGNLVNVRGTPTVFANGRELPRGSLIPVLQEARQEAKKMAQ